MSPMVGVTEVGMDEHGGIGLGARDDREGGTEERRTLDYALQFGREGLSFERLAFSDPVPTGRQVADAAHLRGVADWALIVLLPGGGMTELQADQQLDLRNPGVERVVGFRTDRLYRAVLLDREFLWGRALVTGDELYALATLGEGEALYVDMPGGTDRHIARGDTLDLSAAGVERIVAGAAPVPAGFEVTVLYNGIAQNVRVTPSQTAAALIAASRPLFGNPGGDLVLVDPAGRQLAPERGLGEQGVVAHSRLQLRPPVVQGG